MNRQSDCLFPLDMDGFKSMLVRSKTVTHPLLVIQNKELQALQRLVPSTHAALLDRTQLDLIREEEWDVWLQLESSLSKCTQNPSVQSSGQMNKHKQASLQGLCLALESVCFYKRLYHLVMGTTNLKQCHALFSMKPDQPMIVDCLQQQRVALRCYQATMTFWSRFKYRSEIQVLCASLEEKIQWANQTVTINYSKPETKELLLFMHCDLENSLQSARSSLLAQAQGVTILQILLNHVDGFYAKDSRKKIQGSQQDLLRALTEKIHNPYPCSRNSLRGAFRESYFVLSVLNQKISSLVHVAQQNDEIKFCYELFWQLWLNSQQYKLMKVAQCYVNEKTVETLVLRMVLQGQLQGCYAMQQHFQHLLQLEKQSGLHLDQPYIEVLLQGLTELSRKIWLASQLSQTTQWMPLLKQELALLLGESHCIVSTPTKVLVPSLERQAIDQKIRNFVTDLSSTLMQTL